MTPMREFSTQPCLATPEWTMHDVAVLSCRQAPAVTPQELRERAAAVAGAALARLLDITRRGGLAPLWRVLLGETEARLASYKRAAASTGAHEVPSCRRDESLWA